MPSGPPGILLVNASDFSASGFAFYTQIDFVTGVQPANFIVRGEIPWEGQHSETFTNGDGLAWNINTDAQTAPFGTAVGSASSSRGSFDVIKDDNREVFQLNGKAWRTVYFVR